MPGWGTGSFENESAQEWLKQLGSLNLDDLKRVLAQAGSDPDYLPESNSSIALAAAEAVAALNGSPAENLPPAIPAWVAHTKSRSSPELTDLALAAVRRIVANCELKDLWMEAEGLREWQAAVRELEGRLAG